MRPDKCCVLCGKDSSEVKRFIIGKHGAVCADCVYRCMTILQSQTVSSTPTMEQTAPDAA